MEQTWQMAAAAFVAALAMGNPAMADSQKHDHTHDHSHAQDGKSIYDGYFDDAQIRDRPLSDWQGDWQSVYPYLTDGTLDPVMARKAEKGDKTAAEYRAYYDTGYRTDVDRIVIDGDSVTFHRGDQAATGRYASDGFEILTYAKGNRGVRFIFEKQGGDDAAPGFIQFSDHRIAPSASDHYHLYWGDDRAALLEEVTNWPTYYPASLDADGIVAEMLAH
ncbi:metal-binding protein ZinT [uncultured Paracoccus sp.]|uniref:ZinT family metal-binding protein n=1 Tax=uncultured Paracoccus sp. TaxID=189685 RepID=UPI0025F759E5|nr:metal-binding protein ZinT [uncultured Paracoccus sp.]